VVLGLEGAFCGVGEIYPPHICPWDQGSHFLKTAVGVFVMLVGGATVGGEAQGYLVVRRIQSECIGVKGHWLVQRLNVGRFGTAGVDETETTGAETIHNVGLVIDPGFASRFVRGAAAPWCWD